jgi:thiol:disulfide interchange protein
VLPVIPLKIMSLSAAAGDRVRCLRLGLVMSAGVVAFWLLLGLLVGGLSDFTTSSQLFQYPLFTIGLGLFIAVMAFGMAGFFSVNLPQWVHSIDASHETMGGSFVMGIMTAVLSTPCTAPLMGAAAGWAAASGSLATVLTVFGTIGTGMAAPYALLSAFPQMARSMPRSGPASDVVKQVMGLLLMAAAAFFIGAGVNGWLPAPSMVHWWIVGGFGVAAGEHRTVGVDHHDVVGADLAPQQAARVQQEAARTVAEFGAEVVAHPFGQAVMGGGAQRQRKVGAPAGDGG